MNIVLKVVDVNPETLQVEQIGEKEIRSVERDKMASEWIRKEVKGMKVYDAPQLTSAIGIKQKGSTGLVKNALGYMNNGGNSIYHNQTMVGLYSSAYANGHGVSIIHENIHKVVALFTARKTVKRNWVNWQDEYSEPNTSHEDYFLWNNDCFVYS